MATNTIDARVAQGMIFYAATRGHPPEEVCRRYGLEPALFEDVDYRLPVSTVGAMWRELPVLCGDPFFGLHVAELAAQVMLDKPPLLVLLMQSCATLGESLQAMERFGRVANDVEAHSFEVDAEVGRLSHHGGTGELQIPPHTMEFSFAIITIMARLFTGQPIDPRRVVSIHPAPGDTSEHRRLFGLTPEFGGTHHILELHARDLGLPIQQASRTLRLILERYAAGVIARLSERSELLQRLHRRLLELLPEGTPSLEELARAMGTSPRALQRQLSAEGTNLKKELDRVRFAAAEAYLREPSRSIAEIAFLLGFSEQAAFHRAFVRWTGKSPGAWRRQALRLHGGRG